MHQLLPYVQIRRCVRKYSKEIGGTGMNWNRFSEKLLSTIGAQELGTLHQRLVEEYNKISEEVHKYETQ